MPHDIEDIDPADLELVFEGRRLAERAAGVHTAAIIAAMVNLWSENRTSAAELMREPEDEVDVEAGYSNDDLADFYAHQEREILRASRGWLQRLQVDRAPAEVDDDGRRGDP